MLPSAVAVRALLKDFEQFCTKYDARFRAADTKVEFSYPLLGGETVTESGIVGVHHYYSSLLREAELLHHFDTAAVQTMSYGFFVKDIP